MHDYARSTGGRALRKMSFHERARMIKALALYLNEKKKDLYAISAATGATKGDSWIDIDGGIGNLFVYASKGRRELPDETFLVDGQLERSRRTERLPDTISVYRSKAWLFISTPLTSPCGVCWKKSR